MDRQINWRRLGMILFLAAWLIVLLVLAFRS
jgi:hypothetical protein